MAVWLCETTSALCPRFLYLFLSAFYFYSTLGYVAMIAAPAQLFTEFGKDAPYASLSAYFSRTFGRLTTRLRNLAAESRCNPCTFELGSDNPDSIRIQSQLNPDSPACDWDNPDSKCHVKSHDLKC